MRAVHGARHTRWSRRAAPEIVVVIHIVSANRRHVTTEYMTVEPECVFAFVIPYTCTLALVHTWLYMYSCQWMFFCSLMDATRFQYYVLSRFTCGSSTMHQISWSLRAFIECRILLSFVSKYCDNNTGLQSVSKDLNMYLKSIILPKSQKRS